MRAGFLGAFYDWSAHCWKAPYTSHNLQTAAEWAQKYSLQIEPGKWLNDVEYTEAVLEPGFMESLARQPQKALEPIREMHGQLYPFQPAAVQYALKRKCCFSADPPATGQTIVALASMAAARAFPAVVVCPPAILPHWEKEIASWFPSWSFQILKGESFQANQSVYLVGYVTPN